MKAPEYFTERKENKLINIIREKGRSHHARPEEIDKDKNKRKRESNIEKNERDLVVDGKIHAPDPPMKVW